MTKKRNLGDIFLLVCFPIILGILMVIFLADIYKYNHTANKVLLNKESLKGDVYDFGEISVKLTIRGGEAASWNKDPITDDDGNVLHGQSVGSIYEGIIINNSENTVEDWTMKVPFNEPMWLNNSWNSKMEIHQHAGTDREKTLLIDLTDYYEYDINLDHYIDHTGPMIEMDKGDYFIYYPENIAEEKPIKPTKGDEKTKAVFGFIVYIADQGVDYLADFSGAEVEYRMHASIYSKTEFWVLITLFVIWALYMVVTIVVKIKLKRFIVSQKKQKAHDEMMVEQTMKLIINMIENKDTNTKGHSIRVAKYSRLLAEKMGFNEDECKSVYYIGLLHDCGKVNIPNAILKNPGKLTDEEYAIMKKHTEYGAEVLKDFTSISGIDVGAKYHHERFDGKGYPTGLSGEEIPLIARIICVADAFDAMNSKRVYRDKLDKEVIIDELEKNKDKQFDARIVECLMELINEGKIEL